MSARRRYWLMKSEPDTFSIDDLERVRTVVAHEMERGLRDRARLHRARGMRRWGRRARRELAPH